MDENRQPECWIFAGPNGAGKTTFAMDFLPRVSNCQNFINADLIAAGLAPFSPDTKAYASARIFLHEMSQYIEQRQNFGFETNLSGLSYRKLIKDLRSEGWKVQMVYLALPSLRIARMRVAERVRHGGHDISSGVLKRRYFRSLDNLFNEYIQLPDQVACYSNAGAEPELIFTQRFAHRIATQPELHKHSEIRDSMEPIEKFAMDVEISLRRAVAEELDRKRRLGHYAVFWRDGKVVLEGPDAPDASENIEDETSPPISSKHK